MRIFGTLCALLLMFSGCRKEFGKRDEVRKPQEMPSITKLHKQQTNRCQKLQATMKKDERSKISKEIDAHQLAIIDLVPVDHVWTTDVPVPLQAKNKKNHYCASADQYEAAYIVSQSNEDVARFCLEQMEMHGWQCCWRMQGVESLLFFTKSTKQCAVSIRPHGKNKQELVILQQLVCV